MRGTPKLKKHNMTTRFLVLIALFATSLSCKTVKKGWRELNFFPISQDVALGQEVAKEIAADQKQFPVLPEAGNQEVYAYIRKIMTTIKGTGRVENSAAFTWNLKIIKDDKTLNAFCTPGGHIYVYTGLIKFLDSEDQLAGVMAHEMAHAARRHSTRQLTKVMGVQVLTELGAYLIGTKVKDKQYTDMMKQVTATLITLKFSREHEEEADNYSVTYLCGTGYNAAGSAVFFEKIKGKGGTPPEFMSTHPDPANRVVNIKAKAAKCKGKLTNKADYDRIKSRL
jgi:beta-barrel assembly-enhancing protease